MEQERVFSLLNYEYKRLAAAALVSDTYIEIVVIDIMISTVDR